MDLQEANTINTGYIDDKYIKKAKNYFCAAVIDTLKDTGEVKSLSDAVFNLSMSLQTYSAAHSSNIGVKPITVKDDLLECFFNHNNIMPAYVYYWLYSYCAYKLGSINKYEERHVKIYNELQELYIQRYRVRKLDKKQERQFEKKNRRHLCKVYSSGKYSTTFQLYNTELHSIIDKSDIEDITVMLDALFMKHFKHISDEEQAAAVAYILGMKQGEHNASERAEAAQ